MTSTSASHPQADPSAAVLVAVSEHVATVTLNRPARLNALTPDSLEELRRRLEQLADDTDVRVLVLTGSGRAFSAGGDAAALLEVGAVSEEFVRSQVRVVEVLHDLRPITIAAVNGACAGGGMALACATDLRIAASSAFFAAAYLRIGTTGDLGLPWNLVRLVGLGKAKEISLLGDRVDATEAARIGLVNRLVPDAELAAEVAAAAARLASCPPLAAAGLKRNLNDATDLDFAAFLDVESARFAANAATEDAGEAVSAFIARREPVYRSR